MRVLIAEDDPFVALDLEGILLSHFSAQSVLCATLGSTLSLSHQSFDLALLDVDLTDGKTHDLAGILQRHHVPFAFVSGTDPRDLPEHLQSAPFIGKPYRTDDIVRTVRTLLESPSGRDG